MPCNVRRKQKQPQKAYNQLLNAICSYVLATAISSPQPQQKFV